MLTALKAFDFDCFTWIEHLDLSSGNIKSIKPLSFHGLLFLRNLTLYQNKIRHVSGRTWSGLHSLKVLDLGFNFIESINFALWIAIPKLEELYLDHNAISVVGSRAFHSLQNLRVLHLHHNDIKTLDISVLTPDHSHQTLSLTLSQNQVQYEHKICKAVVIGVRKSKHVEWDEKERVRPGLASLGLLWRPAPVCVKGHQRSCSAGKK